MAFHEIVVSGLVVILVAAELILPVANKQEPEVEVAEDDSQTEADQRAVADPELLEIDVVDDILLQNHSQLNH